MSNGLLRLDDKVGWKQIKACSPSAYSSSAVFTDHTYGFFEGQYRLSPTQPVYRLIDGGNLKETDCYYSSGLQKSLAGRRFVCQADAWSFGRDQRFP